MYIIERWWGLRIFGKRSIFAVDMKCEITSESTIFTESESHICLQLIITPKNDSSENYTTFCGVPSINARTLVMATFIRRERASHDAQAI